MVAVDRPLLLSRSYEGRMRPEAEDGTGDVGGTRPGGLGGIGKNVCQKLKKAIELSLLYSIARAVDPSGLVKCLVCPPMPTEPTSGAKADLP